MRKNMRCALCMEIRSWVIIMMKIPLCNIFELMLKIFEVFLFNKKGCSEKISIAICHEVSDIEVANKIQ